MRKFFASLISMLLLTTALSAGHLDKVTWSGVSMLGADLTSLYATFWYLRNIRCDENGNVIVSSRTPVVTSSAAEDTISTLTATMNGRINDIKAYTLATSTLNAEMNGSINNIETYTNNIDTNIASINSKVATETTLVTISTLAASFNSKDFATETTLNTISTITAAMNGKITKCDTGNVIGTMTVANLPADYPDAAAFKQNQYIANSTFTIVDSSIAINNLPTDYYKGQNITVAVSSGAVEISSGAVSILGAVNVNATITNQVSTQAVKDIYYQVTAPTYTVITAYTSGSTAITFDVDNYSALSLGGDNSFNINSIGTIPINDGKTYTSPVKLKRYVNPTINYTVATGTLTIVIEGYQP